MAAVLQSSAAVLAASSVAPAGRSSARSAPAAPLASSASGTNRSIAHGENAASVTSTAPAMTPVMLPCPALALIAAPPSDSTATIANFDRISATSSSTARTAQIRRAGHTIAANASGSISTITYTAASRISSSIHSANAAPIMNRPTRKARNGELVNAVRPAMTTAALARKWALALPAAEEMNPHS